MKEFAASIIIKDKKILLLQRSEKEEVEANKWNPPNETIEEGENPDSAAVRGVKEETNYEFIIDRFLFGHFYDNKKTHVYLGNISGELKLDPKEVSESDWFSYEDAKKLEYAFDYEKVIEKLHKLELL
jgi:ADP-ribose pyrophosphatase YjhB (NUDIX family)